MTLPKTFRKSMDRFIATYDYTDVAEGTGIVSFYAGVGEISGADVYQINQNAFDIGQALTVSADYERSNIISVTPLFELSPFNLPKVVKGTFYTSFTTALDFSTAATTWKVRVRVYKNSTVIATEYTQTYTADGADKIRTHLVPITIPQTNYKKGDVFKVDYFMMRSSGDSTVYIMHDTMNRDFDRTTPNVTAATNPTRLRIYIPFDLNL